MATRRREPPPTAGAEPWVPRGASLSRLADAVQACRGCPLYLEGTQAVFGEGRARPAIVLVGEQPGDEEDRAGRPFVGPAGRLLEELLAEAGIERRQVFVTNAVKHFHHELRGKRRIHKRPHERMVAACRPWLEEELARTQPSVLVCLGAVAAQALLGKAIRVTRTAGQALSSPHAPAAIATIHPSAILRAPTEADRSDARARLLGDLALARRLAARAHAVKKPSRR